MRKVFLDELPKCKNKINWEYSIGRFVDFQYEDIKGRIKIVDYKPKGQLLYIKYEDKEVFKIRTGGFQKCQIGRLLGKITNEFKIEIGTTYKDEKRDITIIDRKYVEKERTHKNTKNTFIETRKYYKYKCNKCGFECGEHYKDGEFKEEHWISEWNLLNGNGCVVCCSAPQIVVPNINSIVANEETYWMIKYFQGGYEEAKKYTPRSSQKIKPLCPDCGRIRDKEIEIYNIYFDKSISCSCGDGISYANKFMFSVLEHLNIEFTTEYLPIWSEGRKYDFYFKLNENKYIVECHGLQHYEETSRGRNLEIEQENDRIKKGLALNNEIKEDDYIVINCRKSELKWIKSSILKSRLSELFDLNSVDWLECEEFALSNRVKEVCKIKRDNPKIITTEICKIVKLSRSAVANYLKKGTKLGWCEYDGREELLKNNRKNAKENGKRCRKPVEIIINDFSKYIFESISDLSRQSEELFGVKLHDSMISKVCNGKATHYKGFIFKYV